MHGLNIAFFGSSLVSAHWNGAATYFRGMIKALAERGHHITYFEPDAYELQQHRDIADPEWAKVVVYESTDASAVRRALDRARNADLIIKAGGASAFDDMLDRQVLELKRPGVLVVFWDVDAPATLERMRANANDPFRTLVPDYDLVLTYGGGPEVARRYGRFGAAECMPVYNALDPSTHHPVMPERRFEADLAFLANRLPDREARVGEFFLNTAARMGKHRFLIGGNGWADKRMPTNIKRVGHVSASQHNAFNSTPLAVLNIRDSIAAGYSYSPPTRIFEAAGAGACIITDAWKCIEMFLEPGTEVLVAHNSEEVAAHLAALTPDRARRIGRNALRRINAHHTYQQRAEQVEAALEGRFVTEEAVV